MEMLKKLIQIKSVSGGEKMLQEYILEHLSKYGLKTLTHKGNVIVFIGGKNKNNCLIFNAHVDTVNSGNANLWTHDPFYAFEAGRKIYGVGASDNKASVATLLILAKKFATHKPECDVLLTFTVGEEVDGHGTNDTVKWLATNILKTYKNISSIVCEPTGLTCIGIAHKGNLFVKVKTAGISGHGSHPVNLAGHSVIKMYKIISKLHQLGKSWKKKYKNKILGVPTIGLATSIVAGEETTPNKFPDSCSATFDIRTIPEMHYIAFNEIKKSVGTLGKTEYLFPPVAFGFTDKKANIAKVFKTVTKLKFVAFPGSTDMPFFTQKGIPSVIFGPGEIDQMHKANEYCYSDKIGKCVKIFKEAIKLYNELNA
jgi:acetylornithine deacetylase/succinyl-diaminopimelate desuccinylase-like protein